MNVILYLDVFFLVNGVMDSLLLLMVRRFLKLQVRKVRLIGAAGIGAAWACLVVVAANQMYPLIRGTAWLPGAVLMLRAAFGRQNRREFLRSLLLLLIISAAVGGVFAAVEVSGQWSLAGLLFCSVGIVFGGMAAAEFLQEQMRMQKNLYEVTIYYQGNQVKVTALRDTGNQLYEPYGHQPVHVISQETARLLGDTVKEIRYIPFSAVGTEHGILPAIRADRMEIAKDGTEIRRLDRPWLGISREPLSNTNRYQMLLHGEEE